MAARIKTLLGLTAVGLCASVLAPAAAQAQSGSFAFCNVSSDHEYVEFPYHDGDASYDVAPGKCYLDQLSGQDNDLAVAHREVNGQWPAVGTKYFSDYDNVVWYI
jgi:hypothetical protein